MNCKALLTRMSRYIDGDLERDLCKALEAHLRGCDRCRVVFNTTRKTIEIYRETELYPLPTDISRRLHQTLRNRWKTETPK